MISSSELPNEVEDQHPSVECELENLKEELMQRDEHSLDFCTPLQNDEVATTSKGGLKSVRIHIPLSSLMRDMNHLVLQLGKLK